MEVPILIWDSKAFCDDLLLWATETIIIWLLQR